MSSDQASGVVADARTGRPGAEFAVPGGGMVMVVDLDLDLDAGTGSGGGDLRPPAGWPCVVVAISTTPTVPPAAGMDVALTAAVDPPAPWISVSDPAERAAALVSTIERHALASMTLIQVLRAGVALDVDAALVLESLAYATLQAGPEHLTWLRDRQAPPVDARTDPAVRLDRHDDVLEVVLDRPERRNAFSRAMRDDLVAALDVATADPSITEIRLAGAGSNFCSGGDLAEFGQRPDPATAHAVRMARSCGAALARLGPRVQVTLRGACVGAGIELSAFAGRVVADPDVRCWLPEVAMGLIPGAGGTVSLPRRIGAGRTAWLALSGEALDVDTALRWGLVDARTP
jgi:hypothetical protein